MISQGSNRRGEDNVRSTLRIFILDVDRDQRRSYYRQIRQLVKKRKLYDTRIDYKPLNDDVYLAIKDSQYDFVVLPEYVPITMTIPYQKFVAFTKAW